MPRYTYIVMDSSGKRITGTEEATNQEELIARLQSRDLMVINVTAETAMPTTKITKAGFKRPQHGGIKGDDLVLFCRQLATLLGAGVTILKSLDIVSQQVASRRLYVIIKDLEKNMEAGLTFHEAMAKHRKVFSDLWINLVESGEASGNLAVVLSRLASYLERQAAFKKKIISALMYPVILMCAGLGALTFLTVKIIPTFAQMFAGFNLKLPLLTQILIFVSNTVRKYFFLEILGVVGIIFLFRAYIKTKIGRRNFENFRFRLPIFGEFFRAAVVERFSSDMTTLIESGVPILYALEICERSVGNSVVSDIIRQVKEDVRAGKPLREPLEKSGFFDPMVVQMISIGEEIGELAQMFQKINASYQEFVETSLTRFATMFEPLMLLFMGGIIGLMVVGIFLPIFQLTQISGR